MYIRKMVVDDLQAIIQLAVQLGYECSYEQLTERFSTLFYDESTALLVGEVSNIVVAFLQVQESSTLIGGKRCELNAIVIDENMRGKGYGKQIIAAAEDWVRSRGLSKLRLGSRTSRTDAHKFYENYGFKIEKTWFIFSKSI